MLLVILMIMIDKNLSLSVDKLGRKFEDVLQLLFPKLSNVIFSIQIIGDLSHDQG